MNEIGLESESKGKTMNGNRSDFGTTILVLLLSILITFICGLSFNFSFMCVVGKKAMQEPGFLFVIFEILVSEMGYLAGGYILGTLSKDVWNGWAKAFVLVSPNLIF